MCKLSCVGVFFVRDSLRLILVRFNENWSENINGMCVLLMFSSSLLRSGMRSTHAGVALLIVVQWILGIRTADKRPSYL